MDIKKGDNVKILVGKDKGKTGKVLHAFPALSRVIIEGLNTVKKHVRPRRQGESGQVVVVPRPMSVSSVMVLCKACNKPTRIQRQRTDKGGVRVCKKCGSTF